MRFQNINLEGPDCSGKTTLFRKIHEITNFRFNIQDRSCLSMYVYSKLYNRPDSEIWFDKIYDDLKRLDTLYVVLLPKAETILERLKTRGDDFQDESSILEVRNQFYTISKFGLGQLPNVLVLEEEDLNINATKVLDCITSLNQMPGSELIKSLVFNSGQNELVNIQCKEKVNRNNLDYSVLDFPKEKEYYKKITEACVSKIFKEFTGLNEYKMPQKHDSRRFIYTDDSCISFIHFLYRKNELDVCATLRSSNVSSTLWADWEFLKILSTKIADEMNLKDATINLTVNIRSAHIVA